MSILNLEKDLMAQIQMMIRYLHAVQLDQIISLNLFLHF